MKTPESQSLDHALSQAIDDYRGMNPDEVYSTIVLEWPDQLAAMLIEYIFKTTCGHRGGMAEFIEIAREDGDGYYYVPSCSCDFAGFCGHSADEF